MNLAKKKNVRTVMTGGGEAPNESERKMFVRISTAALPFIIVCGVSFNQTPQLCLKRIAVLKKAVRDVVGAVVVVVDVRFRAVSTSYIITKSSLCFILRLQC